MHKLVIVDDEYLVRIGIKETIDWERYGIEVVGVASNGQEGLTLINELHPELVITDIKMPIMNGVDLVKALHGANFKGEIVVLSGYKDFEYAKETFEHGIFSYVVKPIDNDELVEVVLRAKEKYDEKVKTQNLTDKVYTELPTLQSEFLKKLLTSNTFIGLSIKGELANHDITLPEPGVMVVIALEEMFKAKINDLNRAIELLKEKLTFESFRFDGTEVIFLPETNEGEIENKIKDMYAKFEEESLTSLTSAIRPYNSLEYIQKTYEAATKLIQGKLLFHLNTIERELANETSYRHQQSIIRVYKLISDKYSQQLTVKQVASELDVSESYLMHLLKDNIGKTFNEILTGYRIGIAKRLLLSGKYRINEVADMVGYLDVKYFSHVFKKTLGVTPSEYRGHDIE